MFEYSRFLKGVHYSVTLLNVGSVGAVVLIAMVEILGQGACIPPCGETRCLYSLLWTNKVTVFPLVEKQGHLQLYGF